jgi:hypothetical protein
MANEDKSKTGASLFQRAEEYAKNPERMDEFTKEREKAEKEQADKAEAAKKNAPNQQNQAK